MKKTLTILGIICTPFLLWVLFHIVVIIYFLIAAPYGLGKLLPIDFTKYDYVDYKVIEKEIEEPSEDTMIDLLHPTPRQQLIEYMKENNLYIKPKLYYIYSNSRFEQLLEVFEFVEAEESSQNYSITNLPSRKLYVCGSEWQDCLLMRLR